MQTGPLTDQLTPLLRKHAIFSLLDEDKLAELIPKFEMIAVSMGETIIREGDQGDSAYLVYSGKVRALKEGPAGKPLTLGLLSAGDLFGEHAILTDEVRSASCRAAEDGVLFRIQRADFQKLLNDNPALRPYFDKFMRQRSLINFLRLTTFLGALPARQVLALLDQLEDRSFPSGTTIVQEGEPGDQLYLIKSGEVRVTRGRPGEEHVLAYLGPGDYFGERALIRDQPRAASVVALADTDCYSLSRPNFEGLLLLAPQLKEQLARAIERYHRSEELEKQFGPSPPAVAEKPLGTPAEEMSPPREDEPPRVGTRPRAWWRFWKRYPWVPQHDETDCGAAALAMIARHHGLRLSRGRLRDVAQVGREGTSMFNLAAAAENIGFACRAVTTDYGHLSGLPLPAVAHWQRSHFIVLYEVTATHVVAGDPAVGIVTLVRAEFEQGWAGKLLLVTPTARLQTPQPSHSIFRPFWPFLLPSKYLFLQVVLASLLLGAFQLGIPLFIENVVDRTLASSHVHLLNLLLGGMLAVVALYGATLCVRQYGLLCIAGRLSPQMTAGLFRHLLQLPLHYLDSRRVGDLLVRFEDNRRLLNLMAGKALTLGLDALLVPLGLGLMLHYSPRLTLVALLGLLGYVGLTLFFSSRLKRHRQKLAEQEARVESMVTESMQAIRAIKDAAAETTMSRRFGKRVAEKSDAEFNVRRLEMIRDGLSRTLHLLGATLLLWLGAHLVLTGELTVGQFMAFQGLVVMLGIPLVGLLGLWDELEHGLLSLYRLGDLLEAPPERGSDKRVIRVPRLCGHIEFQDVSFRDDAGGQDVLSHIDLEIEPFQTVALVGRPGAGKTTLTMLLQRFLLPTDGKVLLDGRDASSLELRSLREHIGVVTSEPPIFCGTVRENIALADPTAPLDRVTEAAKLAQADGFIRALPRGYETVIGARGFGLSPGQRLQIGLARTLLKDPPILVLDEITATLDPESQQAIEANLPTILHHRTAIVIPHRRTTVPSAGAIVVLDEGRIVERGTHRELLERKGLYYYLGRLNGSSLDDS